jgi:hypothetical protein
MSMEAIEPIAVVTDYDGLVTALRQRVIDLDTSLAAVDDVAGLPAYYTAKPLRNNAKGLGRMSFGAVLGALALKLAVLPDDQALAQDQAPPAAARHRWRASRGDPAPEMQGQAGQGAGGCADEAPEGTTPTEAERRRGLNETRLTAGRNTGETRV